MWYTLITLWCIFSGIGGGHHSPVAIITTSPLTANDFSSLLLFTYLSSVTRQWWGGSQHDHSTALRFDHHNTLLIRFLVLIIFKFLTWPDGRHRVGVLIRRKYDNWPNTSLVSQKSSHLPFSVGNQFELLHCVHHDILFRRTFHEHVFTAIPTWSRLLLTGLLSNMYIL